MKDHPHGLAGRCQAARARHRRRGGTVTLRPEDGNSFDVQRVVQARRRCRLGLLGKRERLEMIGGRFDVRSSAEKGTVVTAWIPVGTTETGPPGSPRRGGPSIDL